MQIARPETNEHAPWYAGYIETAHQLMVQQSVPDLTTYLAQQVDALRQMLDAVDESRAAFAYEPGKWTLAQSLLHVADAERVFSYRLLRIARGDSTALPGFDQDAWVPESGATERSLDSILSEISAVRLSSLALVHSLSGTALEHKGIASGYPCSARALAWMIAGHFAHHFVLTRDRYLP